MRPDIAGQDILAQAGRENFPVAPRILPARFREALTAVYAFARLVDDIGDLTDRQALLDLVDKDLDRIPAGRPVIPICVALQSVVRANGLPLEPFRDLIQANRADQHDLKIASFGELQEYCRLSANPVGHLVLHLVGEATEHNVRLSDRICTALQIIEHLQDVGEDYKHGRIYLPADDLKDFGCEESDLAAATCSPALRAVLAFEAARARSFLAGGTPLIGSLRGAGRIAVAGYVAGGRAALAALESADYEVLRRPVKARKAAVLLGAAGLVATSPFWRT